MFLPSARACVTASKFYAGPITYVASAGVANDTGSFSVTTSGINTTSANLIVAALGTGNSGAYPLTDSQGNTWTSFNSRNDYGEQMCMYYCYNPTVSTSHTFTVTQSGFPNLVVAAFSGAAGSPLPLDQTNSAYNGTAPTSMQPGSITPTTANSVVVCVVNGDSGPAPVSVDSGMTIVYQWPGNNGGSIAFAYKILSSAAAINPTWSMTTNAYFAQAAIASFK